MSESEGAPKREVPVSRTRKRAIAIAAAAALGAGGIGLGYLVDQSEASRPSSPAGITRVDTPPPSPIETKDPRAEQAEAARKSMEDAALQSANSLLDDMAKPQLGMVPYEQGLGVVGFLNKEHPHAEGIPDMYVLYEAKTNIIRVDAVNFSTRTGVNALDSVILLFQTKKSPDGDGDGKVTIDDFKKALAGASLITADIENGWNFDEKTQKEIGEKFGVAFGGDTVKLGLDSTDAAATEVSDADVPTLAENFRTKIDEVTAALAKQSNS